MIVSRHSAMTALIVATMASRTMPAAPVDEVVERGLRSALERCEGAGGDAAMLAALAQDPSGCAVYQSDGAILVQVVARDSGVAARLERAGLLVQADVAVPGGRLLSVALPPSQWRALASVEGIVGVSAPAGRSRENAPASADKAAKTGAVESQAVVALGVDAVRRVFPGVDGTGVKVGVISDTINQAGAGLLASQATGDLPPSDRIQVVADGPAGTDEGRAMMEHVYDIAPGADFGFATYLPNLAGFASNIRALTDQGFDIVVDDAFWEDEPFFQPGPASLAIKRHIASGRIFLTAAGNYGQSCYMGTFTDTNGNGLHEFRPGLELISFSPAFDGAQLLMVLQSTQPYVVSPANVALFSVTLSDKNGNDIANSGSYPGYPQIQGLPPTVLSTSQGPYSLRIEALPSTLPPDGLDLKLMAFRGVSDGGFGVNSSQTEGPIVPHAGIAENIAVGAAPFYDILTPASYSSRGNYTEYFDEAGVPLASPDTMTKPNFLSVDACNNSFFGSDIAQDSDSRPNFLGTSAAAPHAAGVAALMLQTAGGPGTLDQATVRTVLQATGLGDHPDNVDRAKGFGTINALAAVMAVAPTPDIITASIYPNHSGDGSAEFPLATDAERVAIRVPAAQGPATVMLSALGTGADPLFVAKRLDDGALLGVGTSTLVGATRVGDATADMGMSRAGVLSVECASQTAFAGAGTMRIQVDGNAFTIETLEFEPGVPIMMMHSDSFGNTPGCRFYELNVPEGQLNLSLASQQDVVLGVFQIDGTQIAMMNAVGAGGEEVASVPGRQRVILGIYRAGLETNGGFALQGTVSPDIQMPPSITPPDALADILRVNPTSGQSQLFFPVGAAEPLHVAFVPEVSPITLSAFVLSGEFAAGVYDSAGDRVAVRDITSSASFDNVAVTPGATYYFRVLGFPASGTSVDLTLTSTQTAFAATAPAIALTSSASGYYTGRVDSQLSPLADNDYFRIALPADAEFPFRITVEPSPLLDLEFEVNDAIGGQSDYRDSVPAGVAEATDIGPAAVGRNFTVRIAPGRNAGFGGSTGLVGSYVVTVSAARQGSVAATISGLLGLGAATAALDRNRDGVVDAGDLAP